MITSHCCCDKNTHDFSEYIVYRQETTFKEYEGTVIGKCSSCGLLRTFAPKQSKFNPKQSDYSFYEKNINLFTRLFGPNVRGIQKYVSRGTVLDIGCSSGLLLGLLKNKGYKVFGIEPNKYAFRLAKNKFGNAIFHGTLDTYISKKVFDVVILSHVLEHVENPVVVIEIIKRMLAKNGILLIGIPNTRNIIFLLRRKYWEYLRPNEHVWHFSDTYLINMLKNNGFTVLEKWYVNDSRSDYRFVKRLYFQFLCFLNTIFGMGETVTVICKKS